MPRFHDKCKTDPDKLHQLNQCRMFCEAVSLSDIANLQGDKLWPSILEGKGPVNNLRGIPWPRHPPSLPAAWWDEWRRALQECFLQPYSRWHLLAQPMGDWLLSPKKHSQWRHWGDCLWQKTEDCWCLWRAPSRNSQPEVGTRFHRTKERQEPPHEATPATAMALPSGTQAELLDRAS